MPRVANVNVKPTIKEGPVKSVTMVSTITHIAMLVSVINKELRMQSVILPMANVSAKKDLVVPVVTNA
jgi:hypothetical protein